MPQASEPEVRVHNIVAYGFDKLPVRVPKEPIQGKNFIVHFEPYDTPRRLQEFDGALVFQGLFESFSWEDGWDGRYLSHTWDNNMLDRRMKELHLLATKGGFTCCLLTQPFIEREGRKSFETTDMSKLLTHLPNFYRKQYGRRQAHVKAVADELKRFLDLYGAAWTFFEEYGTGSDIAPLATVGRDTVGLSIDGSSYLIPCLPLSGSTKVDELVTLLLDGVTAIHNKSRASLPEWAREFEFVEETDLRNSRTRLLAEISAIDGRMELLDRYRSTLVLSDDKLVRAVAAVLEIALGVKVDTADDLKEDIKLKISNEVLAVGEVKGINRGVARQHINQADSHRERSGFPPEFPCLLIANTNIKSARSVPDKDQEIDPEQVKHATQMGVLVIRTLDLLGLLKMVLGGELTPEQARHVVLNGKGWLRIVDGALEVKTA